MHSKWSNNCHIMIPKSHNNHMNHIPRSYIKQRKRKNQISPIIKQCMERAKSYREIHMKRMRERVGYGYNELAMEILSTVQSYNGMDWRDESIVDELSDMIQTEYAIIEEQNLNEFHCINDEEEVDWTQLQLSEYDESLLLLCPYCRCAVMTLDDEIGESCEGTVYRCEQCDERVKIRGNCDISQLREVLAAVFDRHHSYCAERQGMANNYSDSSLAFKQIDYCLHAGCDRCGFEDVVVLS
mmetsp:Transcript_3465/g.5407  ORF Transcript_3465/g.5407 Transcript_3465/m.5407 type:complete len:241 (-) Transcript_3465:19-741(-)